MVLPEIVPPFVGTPDEVFETATLIQTGKIKDFPLVLVANGAVSPEDPSRLILTDSSGEAVVLIREREGCAGFV